MVVTPQILIQTMLELALLVLTLHGVLAAPDPEYKEDKLNTLWQAGRQLAHGGAQLEQQMEIFKTAEMKIQELNGRKPDLEQQQKEAIRLISADNT